VIDLNELADAMIGQSAGEAAETEAELFTDDGPTPESMNGDRPQSIDELPYTKVSGYDLSTSQAVSAGIPVLGSGGDEKKKRVIVQEWSSYKLYEENGERLYVGYAIRLSVTINERRKEIKIGLPFLAAGAQLGRIEAQWVMEVIGLQGPKVREAIQPPAEFNVERYVDAMRSLAAIGVAAGDPTTVFTPVTIKREPLVP
jgi:hypothetical protein